MSDNQHRSEPEFSRHRGAGIGEEIREGKDKRGGWRFVQCVARRDLWVAGPEWRGKTTTIGVLTTAILPTEGSASIMSVDVTRDPISVKQRIAVVPQQSNLDRSLKVREILTFHARVPWRAA